jgi:hypothetical protein
MGRPPGRIECGERYDWFSLADDEDSSMAGLVLAAIAVVVAQGGVASTADVVTLRDGSVVQGQTVDSAERGRVAIVVRREWAREHQAKRLKAWEAAEARVVQRARRERLERLRAWEQERRGGMGVDEEKARNDPLLRSIARSIERLEDNRDPSPILHASIDRREVAKVERRPAREGRLLRMGWLAGLAGVETTGVDELRAALEGRNFAVEGDEAVSIETLLPVVVETEPEWRLKRAAAEVQADRSVWFVRHGNLVAPEDARPDGLNLLGPSGIGDLSSLMRELTGEGPAEDPLLARLKAVAARGGIGVLVTRLAIESDLSGVEVTATLWVRATEDPGSWRTAGERTARVKTADVAAGAGQRMAADAQVKGVFEVFDALGLGQVSPEMKERALAIGAAAQMALGQVREMANADLNRLAVKLDP